LFFTLDEGFAIPVTGRKTTEVHARYANPPTHERARSDIYISTRTFIVAVAASYEFCEDSS
jgi:hypothetical protein